MKYFYNFTYTFYTQGHLKFNTITDRWICLDFTYHIVMAKIRRSILKICGDLEISRKMTFRKFFTRHHVSPFEINVLLFRHFCEI